MDTQPLSTLYSLTGKTAIITGGAMGIGARIAERYAEVGANLLLIDVNEAAATATSKRLAEEYAVTVDTAIVDLSDPQAIDVFWSELSIKPDILVNNAGIFGQSEFTGDSFKNYEKTMAINTQAVFLLCRGMIRHCGKKHGGVIVNISSIEARSRFTANMIPYGASKAAVLAITRGITKDYGKYGWRVNSILPGGIQTPGANKMGMAALKRLDFSLITTGISFSMRLAAKRMGQPDDIARVAVFMASDMSAYMYGSEVVVDGGFLAI